MAFATGTFQTPAQLLNAINTLLTGNGWTRLRGNTNMNVASPKAARYWRVTMYGRNGGSVYGLNRIQLRGTPGGASLLTDPARVTMSALTSGTVTNVISGGNFTWTSGTNNYFSWTMTYDFGAPTTIRECVITATTTVNSTPKNYTVEYSSDGLTWDVMYTARDLSLASGATQTFTFDDAYVDSIHPASNAPFRAGRREDENSVNFGSNARGNEVCEDVWTWQGPGYDADRRVFVSMRGHALLSYGGANIEAITHIAFDPNILSFFGQVGSMSGSKSLFMGTGEKAYWIYANSHRVVAVVRTGSGDYTSLYAGFMGSFTQPEYYPFPLAVVGTTDNWEHTATIAANNRYSSIVDPGTGMLSYRRWDGTFVEHGNRQSSSTDGIQSSSTGERCWVWPTSHGCAQTNGSWQSNGGAGGNNLGNQRLVDFIVATEQAELPLIPAIVTDAQYGNIGVLSDVFVVPSGGILVPNQVINIGGDDYRVFPNRERRNGGDFFAIREAA